MPLSSVLITPYAVTESLLLEEDPDAMASITRNFPRLSTS